MRDKAASSAREMDTLLTAMSDAVLIADAQGQITQINPAYRALVGLSPDQELPSAPEAHIAGLNIRDSDGQSVPVEEMVTQRAARGEQILSEGAVDYQFHTYSGEERWASATAAPLYDAQGEIVSVITVLRDITERKRAEEALRRAHDKLEQRVAQRTRELADANRLLRRLSQRVLEVQENERRIIARELHDEIGQQLTGAKMLLESLAEQLREAHERPSAERAGAARPDGQELAALKQLREIVGETLEEVRDLALELRPAVLDSLGLVAALQWLFERYTSQTGVQVDFATDGLEQRLPQRLEAVAYRIVQEALTNVARYANVVAVTVQLYATEEALSLYIVDDGIGFDTEDPRVADDSTGFEGMRERANLLGGTLTVDSLPGEGTTIHAVLPIQQTMAAAAAQEVEQEGEALLDNTARHRARDELRDRARDEWRDAARDARRDTMRDMLRDTTRNGARDQARDQARDTTRGAAQERQEERKDGGS